MVKPPWRSIKSVTNLKSPITFRMYFSYLKVSSKTLLYSSLSCTEWVRGRDGYMFPSWNSIALSLLDELWMKRWRLLGLQMIPIASNRPVTLWQKQSSSWRVKRSSRLQKQDLKRIIVISFVFWAEAIRK